MWLTGVVQEVRRALWVPTVCLLIQLTIVHLLSIARRLQRFTKTPGIPCLEAMLPSLERDRQESGTIVYWPATEERTQNICLGVGGGEGSGSQRWVGVGVNPLLSLEEVSYSFHQKK